MFNCPTKVDNETRAKPIMEEVHEVDIETIKDILDEMAKGNITTYDDVIMYFWVKNNELGLYGDS